MSELWNGLLRVLGGVLAVFYSFIPSLGVAIILLTLAISLLMFPLTLKQTRSMRAMQQIQPEVKRIQKELKGDRQRLNQELMALYQEKGVNPAAGCLPMLLQMPIWFALFRVLRTPVKFDGDELVRSYVGTTTDLFFALQDAVRDGMEKATRFLGMNLLDSPSDSVANGFVSAIPYILLILIVVASGYYQNLQTTKRTDSGQQQPQQMQTVMKIMPFFFGFISWTLPAGLVLYFAVSQGFRVGQQALILHMEGPGGGGGTGKRTEDEKAPPPKPPQPGSRKRRKKKRRR
ncbi:MAG: YidC/Oxa1 family membrane protein insertase [Dehalococcoidia bacterium]